MQGFASFFFFCVVIFSTLLGCASKVYIPGNRFLVPESSGGFFQGDFKIGGVGVTHIQVADSVTSATPDTTPILVKNTTAAIASQIGLVDRVDVYMATAYEAPNTLGIKIQLLGDSMPSAKSGNLSFAIAGGANIGDRNHESTVNDIKGTAMYKFGGWEAMAILGWRANDNALFYLSPFKNTLTADVKIERTEGGSTTTTAEPNGSGEMKGITFGVRFGKSIFVNAEASRTETVWTRKQPTEIVVEKFSDTALGLALGGSW